MIWMLAPLTRIGIDCSNAIEGHKDTEGYDSYYCSATDPRGYE